MYTLTYIYTSFLSTWPEVRGTADTDGGAYSPFRSILLVLTTLSSSRSTDRRAETDRMVGDADAGMRTILYTV